MHKQNKSLTHTPQALQNDVWSCLDNIQQCAQTQMKQFYQVC